MEADSFDSGSANDDETNDMSVKTIKVSWDWKAGATDIAAQLTNALRAQGSSMTFIRDRDTDGDDISLLCYDQSEVHAPSHIHGN